MNRSAWTLTVILLAFGAILLYAANPFSESDSFYHLKTGELIWETRSIPQSDPFSYTAEGRPWVPHEWLAQLLFYGISVLGGLQAVVWFAALLGALTYFILFRMLIRRGADPVLSLLLLFLAGFLTLELWVGRPQVFAYLCLALLLFSLERYRFGGGAIYLWLAAGTMWLWANVNASFLLGLAVLGLYLAASLAKRYFPRLGVPGTLPVRNMLLVLLASLTLSFLTPAGYQAFLYPFYIRPAVAALKVYEWRSILEYAAESEAKVFLAEVSLAAVFLAWWLGFRKQSRDPILLLLIAGASVLPFISARHAGFWPILAGYPLALGISEILKPVYANASSKKLWGGVAFVFLVFIGARSIGFPEMPVDRRAVPVAAAEFLAENRIRGPLFNFYNEGGFLIWRFYPEEKVFIDGRSEVYPPEVISEYFEIATAGEDWVELVDRKYGINYFLISYRTLSPSVIRLVQVLMQRNWVLAYWDDAAVIFLRNIPAHEEAIGKYGLRHVSPFREPGDIPPEESMAAAAELKVLLERSPESDAVRDYLRAFLGTRSQ